MKKIFLFILAAFLCNGFMLPPDENETKVVKAAQDNLALSLSKIPEGKESLYGFASRSEFSTCTVGTPYRVVTFNDAFFKDKVLTNKNYLQLQNEWRVPVMKNKDNRLLLTVINQNENYTVVDLGGNVLSKELQEKTGSFNNSDSRFILRIYPLALDFLVKAGSGSLANAEYIPLTSALMGIESLKTGSKSFYTLAEVQQLIKSELNNHPKN